jgi:hypothetical protein
VVSPRNLTQPSPFDTFASHTVLQLLITIRTRLAVISDKSKDYLNVIVKTMASLWMELHTFSHAVVLRRSMIMLKEIEQDWIENKWLLFFLRIQQSDQS